MTQDPLKSTKLKGHQHVNPRHTAAHPPIQWRTLTTSSLDTIKLLLAYKRPRNLHLSKCFDTFVTLFLKKVSHYYIIIIFTYDPRMCHVACVTFRQWIGGSSTIINMLLWWLYHVSSFNSWIFDHLLFLITRSFTNYQDCLVPRSTHAQYTADKVLPIYSKATRVQLFNFECIEKCVESAQNFIRELYRLILIKCSRHNNIVRV